MIHQFKILVKTGERESRKSIVEAIEKCLKSNDHSMIFPFAIKDVTLDNHFLNDLRRMKSGHFLVILKEEKAGYANFAKSLGLDIIFRSHSENQLKLYVIDTLW